MKCARCNSEKVRVMTKSPVGNVWEVYVCDKCSFSWRSTEDIKISPTFLLNDKQIAEMQEIPPVPPLKGA